MISLSQPPSLSPSLPSSLPPSLPPSWDQSEAHILPSFSRRHIGMAAMAVMSTRGLLGLLAALAVTALSSSGPISHATASSRSLVDSQSHSLPHPQPQSSSQAQKDHSGRALSERSHRAHLPLPLRHAFDVSAPSRPSTFGAYRRWVEDSTRARAAYLAWRRRAWVGDGTRGANRRASLLIPCISICHFDVSRA